MQNNIISLQNMLYKRCITDLSIIHQIVSLLIIDNELVVIYQCVSSHAYHLIHMLLAPGFSLHLDNFTGRVAT